MTTPAEAEKRFERDLVIPTKETVSSVIRDKVHIMKNLLSYLISCLLVSFIAGCESETLEPATGCMYNAVVEDFSGLDGCGYLFKLESGEYLEPVWRWGWCATPPLPEGATEDPLWDFVYEDGKQVRISFEYKEQYGSYCMKGEPVIITCLSAEKKEPDPAPEF